MNLPFRTDRLASFAGYSLPPTVLDAMLFLLPKFTLGAYRIVEGFQRIWELWSPNDERTVYYPGARQPGSKLGLSLPPAERRYDGHLGRYDPTMSPQLYDKGKPWLGFIQVATDSAAIESTPFLNVWTYDRSLGSNRISAYHLLQLARRVQTLHHTISGYFALKEVRADLWDSRPTKPDKDDVAELGLYRFLDEAVDRYASMQRGIKLLAAWCRMAEAYIKNPPSSCKFIDWIPPANSTLIGVWLNGCEEEEGLWLLANRVPCYLIHEVDPNRDVLSSKGTKRFDNFLTGTTIIRLRPTVNPLDQLAKKAGHELQMLEREIGMADPGNYVYLRSDREKSSPSAQGWKNEGYVNPRLSYRVTTTTVDESLRDEAMDPPPVTKSEGKKWTDWAEEEIDDEETAFFQQGKNLQITEDTMVYYDRINARRLYLDHPLKAPKGYRANHMIFGIPFPKSQFFEKQKNGKGKKLDPTTWVYFSLDIEAGDLGRCYQSEAPEDQSDGTPLPGWSEEEQAERRGLDLFPATANDEYDSDVTGVSIPSDDYDPYSYWQNQSNNVPLLQAPSSVETLPPALTPPRPIDTDRPASPSPPPRPRNSPSPRHISPFRTSRTERPRRRSRSRGFRERNPPPYRREERVYRPERRDQYTRSPSPRRRSPQRHRNSHHHRDYDYQEKSYRTPASSSRYDYRRSPSPEFRPSFSRRHNVTRRSVSPSRSVRMRSVSPPPPALAPSDPNELVLHAAASPPPPSSVTPTFGSLELALQAAASLPPPSLLDRLATPDANGTATSSSTALVALQDLALRAMADPSEDSLSLNFPTPMAPNVPVLSEITREGRSRFLILWNFPVYRIWEQVITWILGVNSLVPSAILLRVSRTNEGGQQVFWLAFKAPDQASAFRGQVAGRNAADGSVVACDFVSADQYSAVFGAKPPSWVPGEGFSHGLSLSSPLEMLELERKPNVTILSRLGMQPDTTEVWTRRKVKRGKRKPRPQSSQDPADGGAL
ncbi:hypothetical protein D9613_005607 [Agrocybe pediades]|uniref:Uncharacterized protein n=1 Tax=Agrocybe pediades TaxID=84607 RepID=A0A8H4QXV5_9AGAR|nr:hypothetical protein D9613_002914 [Agrocybe pediades]KAF4619208.1 hypothetical protein D9613_005607 [Agrocybe pediades]